MLHRPQTLSRSTRWLVGLLLVWLGAWCLPAAAKKPPGQPPNILYIALDDVGIDQMKVFGYGGASAPRTPNIDTIAQAGVRFRNFWTMPECSPSRALMFEGRYPLRTNVYDAILSVDLANSQVSPYETTTPRVLKQAGYSNALFGKFHLSGSNINATGADNNPLGFTAVYQLGWDYFAGWQDGAPHPIDSSAGGVAPANTYSCGFVPNTTQDPSHGADTGACYFVDNSCTQITRSTASPTPGRSCMERGGIFDPQAVCRSPHPSAIDFSLQNGYYAGQLIINQPNGTTVGAATVIDPQDPSGASRGYRSILESEHAIQWIKAQPSGTPWMATVAYSSAHTPYQQVPAALLPAASPPAGGFDCTAIGDQRVLSNQMIEAMDTEIGRVLVETGLATRRSDGSLDYDPARSNTMIVILGDNGTYAPGVKAPFNPTRAKATVYQTGVWTPLIVAGPLVRAPGREVNAMVNIADIFQLFGDIGGVDVHKLVPKSRPIDSVAMLPYLTDPDQKSLRKTNFTQTQPNLKAAGYVVPPCAIPGVNACIQLFPSQALCGSEGGVWWGSGDDGSAPVGAGAPQANCCGVNQYQQVNHLKPFMVLPDWQMAMRDDDYKLVRSQTTDYDSTSQSCVTTPKTEFYEVNQERPPRLKLDNLPDDLLGPHRRLSPQQRHVLASLEKELDKLLDSQVACPGDGNLDGVVDTQDIEQYNYWASLTGAKSSWYDFNLDGLTTSVDVALITDGKFPRKCKNSQSK